jgi:hypothetical protein
LQRLASKKGDTSFWPYDGAPSESSTPYVFKKAPTDASLKTKRDRDTTDPVYCLDSRDLKKKKGEARALTFYD